MFWKSADADNHPKPAQHDARARVPCSGPPQTRTRRQSATTFGGLVRRRSNLLVLLGIAFFLVGGIIVYVVTDDDDTGGSGLQGPVSAIVGNQDISAGALADDLIEQGRLKEIKVPAGELSAGAIQSINQLEGATFVQGFAENQPITRERAPARQPWLRGAGRLRGHRRPGRLRRRRGRVREPGRPPQPLHGVRHGVPGRRPAPPGRAPAHQRRGARREPVGPRPARPGATPPPRGPAATA